MKTFGLVLTLVILVTAPPRVGAGEPRADASNTEPVRIYHWPYLKFTSYTDAHAKKWLNGDVDLQRAFYWGRVIGCDGVAFNIRGLTQALEEGNWFEPVYRNETEKSRLFDRLRRFQVLYAKNGCRDNFLHLHAHPPMPQHPTHGTQDVAQWRRWVLAGMEQRAELLRHLGTQRILIDLEFASQQKVDLQERFWFDLGRRIARTIVRQHPQIRIGFYPGLYYHMSRKPPKRLVLGDVAAGDLRHALLKGLYAGRGKHPLWYYSGYTYSIVDGTVAEKGATYVWDLPGHLRGLLRAHRQALGPEVEFMPGRWDLGATHQPGRLFGGLFKQPNLSLEMMRRDYRALLQHTRMIGIWDHGWSWDPGGSGYKRFETDAELARWKAELARIAISSRYHKNLGTNETWHLHVAADAPLEKKLQWFHIVKSADGVWFVSGKLAPNFADYVNLVKQLSGKQRVPFPLHTKTDVTLAEDYQVRGFFPGRAIVLGQDKRWPHAVATMAKKSP